MIVCKLWHYRSVSVLAASLIHSMPSPFHFVRVGADAYPPSILFPRIRALTRQIGLHRTTFVLAQHFLPRCYSVYFSLCLDCDLYSPRYYNVCRRSIQSPLFLSAFALTTSSYSSSSFSLYTTSFHAAKLSAVAYGDPPTSPSPSTRRIIVVFLSIISSSLNHYCLP